ncbi:hypothetical protein ACLB2K_041955 [Fragaria x ananassa]
MEGDLWRDCCTGGGLSFEPRIAGYGGRRREFRRRKPLGSRSSRRAFLLIGGTREPLADLEWKVGRRPTDLDRRGGLGRLDGVERMAGISGRREEAEEIIINAPKLQNFVVYGRGRAFTKYIMQNVKSLVKANIENTYIPEDEEDEEDAELLNRATALLAGVSSVEYLHLPGPRFETCSLPNFCNLKQLKLNLFGCSYLEYVMELLKRTPKLEDLVLDIDFSSWYDEEYEGHVPFEPPEIVPICVVSHLKNVSITQITGHDDQLDMVKYLLRYGEVLRNMTIVTCGILLFKTRHITEEKFQKEILMYPKISNTCDVEVKFENKGVISDRCSDCGSDRLWCPGI